MTSALVAVPVVPAPADAMGRALRDLRISVTDRCNFRCPYCMPRGHFGPGYRFLPTASVLTLAEIERLARVFVSLGVTKMRVTGGEPLLRADVDRIVAALDRVGGVDLALTTNGVLLERRAAELKRAGLQRVTVSLDSLHPDVFAAMSDIRLPVTRVLNGIRAAREAGLSPIKVNCVVRRGVNEDGILDLVAFALREDVSLRFIEYMDVGTSNGWRLDDVVTGDEILARVSAAYRIEELPDQPSAVARSYRVEGSGEIGVITSVSRPFCGNCTRARMSADGNLFTCLFASTGLDLRTPLRDGASDRALRDIIAARWRVRNDRYSELRAAGSRPPDRVEMSYIGG